MSFRQQEQERSEDIDNFRAFCGRDNFYTDEDTSSMLVTEEERGH